MKLSCISKLILFWIFSFSLLHADENNKSALIYYGNEISWPMAGVHDYIIVEPEHIKTQTHGFETYASKVYAYIPLGEVQASQHYYKKIKSTWILGKNKIWKSEVVDLSNADYRQFILDEVIAPLHEEGFKNFFFDTLDSYEIVIKDEKGKRIQQEGLVSLIQGVHNRWPDAKLILNRGFEIFPEVEKMIEAILFESYYRGLDEKLSYRLVDNKEREWLDDKLTPIRKSGKPIIALDYMADPFGKEAVKNFKRLQESGFIPYIATSALDRYGIGVKQPLKREVLMLYNRSKEGEGQYTYSQSAHLYGSLPLEYLGFVPVLKDISEVDLSKNIADRFAGVIIWLDRSIDKPEKLFSWVKMNARNGVRTLFLGSFGMKKRDTRLSKLDISLKKSIFKPYGKAHIVSKARMMDYELPVAVQFHDEALVPKNAKALFAYKKDGVHSLLAAVMPWGGYAVDEASMVSFGKDTLWSVDPFQLYKKTLRLPDIPVPDPTTENGVRLMFTHIDGDGVMNRAEFDPERYSGEVIYEHILKRFDIPHTVSFVGGEIFSNGLYPKESEALQKIAKKIYALPQVETATHTFSHPFKWREIRNAELKEEYRLKIPGYQFSLTYEIEGMMDTTIEKLATVDTRKSRLVLWTGDCQPSKEILDVVAKAGIVNMNGGDTYITNDKPWLSLIAPYGIAKGSYYQVYTGAQNENIYTKDFIGPFWGYKKVIQTFERTDRPRRFKPIDIYYHFYAGSKMASLKALESVFSWAMMQESMPVYTTEYIDKMLGFNVASMLKEKDRWEIFGLGTLKTVRFPTSLGYPKINLDNGVIGFTESTSGRYVSLLEKEKVSIVTSSTPEDKNYLIKANGTVKVDSAGEYHFHSYVPFWSLWNLKKGCSLDVEPEPDERKILPEGTKIIYNKVKEVSVNVICQ